MNKILSILLLMSTPFVFAQATDDNEVMVTQVGDTLKLYVDQIGFGNKLGLNNFSSGSGSNMTVTGVTLDFKSIGTLVPAALLMTQTLIST